MNVHEYMKESAMRRRRFMSGALTAIGLAGFAGAPASAADFPLRVAYAYPRLLRRTHEALAAAFMAETPDIRIRFAAPAADYEQLTQTVLRASMSRAAPEVAFHGLDRIRFLAERALVAPLDDRIAQDGGAKALGYESAMLDLGRVDGAVYGLPFSVSTPVVYYNADLVVRAGGDPDRLPRNWDAILDLAKRIDALDGRTGGIHFDYYGQENNWTFQALVLSFGGTMMSPDETAIGFDGPSGLKALSVLAAIGEAGMIEQSSTQATQAFGAGRLGVFVISSARLASLENAANGRFSVRTGPFPVAEGGRLPVGGNAAVIHARDPEAAAAAWRYIRFVAGPEAQSAMARNTGYLPGNSLAVAREDLLGDFIDQHPNYATAAAQLSNAAPWYSFPGSNARKIPDVIREILRRTFSGQLTPEAALERLKDEIGKLV